MDLPSYPVAPLISVMSERFLLQTELVLLEVKKSHRYIFAFQAKRSQVLCFPFQTYFLPLSS